MYAAHFGLQQKAFGNTPDPRFLFLNESYEEAMACLLYAIEERELALLVGPIGTGKSLMIRALIDRMEHAHEIAVILNPRLSPTQLLRAIALELGIEEPTRFKAELFNQIQDRLLELDDEGRSAVLIVDEAQLIPKKAAFDELRLLTNFQLDDRNLISLLLVGQPELTRRFRHPAYRALTQRFGVVFRLENMDRDSTRRYLDHRLRVAGGNGQAIFTPEAVSALHGHSEGVPRVVNRLATHCLIEGFVQGRSRVDADQVNKVAGSALLPH